MEVRTGGQGGVKSVNVRQAAGNHRIGINKEEIPLHILPHAGFQEAGALHGRQGRIQIHHLDFFEKCPERPGERALPKPPFGREPVCQKRKEGIRLVAGTRGCAHESLFQIDIFRAAD